MNEPEPPVNAPKHLKKGLPKQSPAMLHALAQWVEEQPPEVDEDDETIATIDPGHVSSYSRIVKYQRCGDETCKCTSGTQGDMHGTYLWHVYTRSDGTRYWSYQHNV